MIGGCSGSLPAPSENRPIYDAAAPWKLRREPFRRELYGSRTTCYFLRHDDTFIVVDHGLGIGPVSEFILDMLEAEGKAEAVIHCLQTHYHEDHLEGFRSNSLMFHKGLVLRFYSPELSAYRQSKPGGPSSLQDVLRSQFCQSYWTVTLETLDEVGAQREHICYRPGETLRIDDVAIETIPLTHPSGCSGMRFKLPSRKCIIIATDYEPPPTPDPAVVEFFEEATLLLGDMQYRDNEYEGTQSLGRLTMSRRGWGHGTPERLLGTVLGCRTKPEKMRIVHHDPRRSDMELRMFYEETVNLLEQRKSGSLFDYEFAHDGDIYWI